MYHPKKTPETPQDLIANVSSKNWGNQRDRPLLLGMGNKGNQPENCTIHTIHVWYVYPHLVDFLWN